MLTEQALLEAFGDPPSTYRPQPFWFINHDLDRAEIVRQVQMMHEKGVGGFIFHARHGLGDAFMTQPWLEALAAACAEAEKLGMVVWLYDEDNWPSGTMGGRLTKAHPELRMRYLRYWETRQEGPTSVTLQPEMDDNTLYKVLLTPLREQGDTLQPVVAQAQDVTTLFDSSAGSLVLPIPPGPHVVSFFFLCPVPQGVTFRNGYYLDTLDREACREFVRCCYEPNIAAVEHYLGKTVRGIFTDEPGLMIHDGFFGTQAFRPTVQEPGRRLPGYVMAWSRHFPAMFQEWRGYDLNQHLLALVYETSPEDIKVRQDYYRTATQAYLEHYYGALREFTQAHGLLLIGHTLEEPIWSQARSQGNQHLVVAQYDIPGYDYLSMQGGIATAQNPARLLAAQCAYSVAALKGGERIMVEAFGGSGNAATLAQRRRHANLMALLGTSLFVPHAFFQSFAGERKSDWPPSEFYQAAFWEQYDYFSAYLGRIGLIAHAGKPVAPVMILSPIHTAYRQIASDGALHRVIGVDATFSRLSYDLLAMQRNHIYIDEQHLVQGKLHDGGVGFNAYVDHLPVLIVPDATILGDETVLFLQEFVRVGGRILWLGQIPTVTTSGASIPNVFQGPGNRLCREANPVEIEAILNDWSPMSVRVRGECPGQVLALCKRLETRYLVSAYNSSETEPTCATLELGGGEWQIEELDPETGQREPRGGRTATLAFELTPSQLRTFLVGPAVSAATAIEPQRNLEWLPCQATRFARTENNILPLDEWSMSLSVPPAEHQPILHCMGHTTVIRYRSHFVVRSLPQKVTLLLDDIAQYLPAHYGVLSGYRDCEVLVNGQLLPPLLHVDYPDHYFTGADITSLVRLGDNQVALYVAQSNERPAAPTLQYPMMICGDFSLSEQDELVAVDPAKAAYWDGEGAPYYSGVGRYFFAITLDAPCSALWLGLGEVHDSARIIVNGQVAATRGWAPYVLQVRADWRLGENQVEVQVANTAANLWEKRRERSGMAGLLRYARG
jgi:hypothetical protein